MVECFYLYYYPLSYYLFNINRMCQHSMNENEWRSKKRQKIKDWQSLEIDNQPRMRCVAVVAFFITGTQLNLNYTVSHIVFAHRYLGKWFHYETKGECTGICTVRKLEVPKCCGQHQSTGFFLKTKKTVRGHK